MSREGLAEPSLTLLVAARPLNKSSPADVHFDKRRSRRGRASQSSRQPPSASLTSAAMPPFRSSQGTGPSPPVIRRPIRSVRLGDCGRPASTVPRDVSGPNRESPPHPLRPAARRPFPADRTSPGRRRRSRPSSARGSGPETIRSGFTLSRRILCPDRCIRFSPRVSAVALHPESWACRAERLSGAGASRVLSWDDQERFRPGGRRIHRAKYYSYID